MKKILILTLVLLIMILPATSALIGSLGNGRVILHEDVEAGQPTIVESYILVMNDNAVAVNVDLIPMKDIKDVTKLSDDSFVLQPDEKKRVDIVITLTQPGFYDGGVGVTYSTIEGESGSARLMAQVLIDAGGGPGIGGDIDDELPVDDDVLNEDDSIVDEESSILKKKLPQEDSEEGNVKSWIILLTSLLVVVLILLLIIYISWERIK